MIEVIKESHEVVDGIVLRLSPDAAKQLAGLLIAVPVSTTTDVFDNIAEGIAAEFFYNVPEYVVDENGEYGPAPEFSGGCGCGGSDEEFLAGIETHDITEGL